MRGRCLTFRSEENEESEDGKNSQQRVSFQLFSHNVKRIVLLRTNDTVGAVAPIVAGGVVLSPI